MHYIFFAIIALLKIAQAIREAYDETHILPDADAKGSVITRIRDK